MTTKSETRPLPPYPIPLRGIQVKIRVFEPDSRQFVPLRELSAEDQKWIRKRMGKKTQ